MTVDVLVVGGGIVGCAIASACAKAGLGVTLLERGRLAGGASSIDLALLGRSVPPAVERLARRSLDAYLELHHFTGQTFFLDRSDIECDGEREARVRRVDVPGATLALAEEGRSYRAELRTGCDVKDLVLRGRVVLGARTDEGEVRAGTTVVAPGAESWRVCRSLPLHLPLADVEGVCAVYPPGALELERPLLAGGGWAAPDRVGRVVAAEPERLPARAGLLGRSPLERRMLRYATTADRLPLHGPLPGVQGLVVACGHGERGVALAPATGSAIAAGITTGAWDETLLPERLL